MIEELKWEDSQKLRERDVEYQWTLFKTWSCMQQNSKTINGGVAENSSVNSATGLEAKLPKLVIIKFNGTFQDWPRFWGQHSKATDKLSFASKFSYLRELLAPKVSTSMEALRFSPEGYNRTKSILMDKYGQESEIIKAYNREFGSASYSRHRCKNDL